MITRSSKILKVHLAYYDQKEKSSYWFWRRYKPTTHQFLSMRSNQWDKPYKAMNKSRMKRVANVERDKLRKASSNYNSNNGIWEMELKWQWLHHTKWIEALSIKIL